MPQREKPERLYAPFQFEAADGSLDVTVRPSHVATRTIQELLCGQFGGAEFFGALDAGLDVADRREIFVELAAVVFAEAVTNHPASVSAASERVCNSS